MGAYKTSAKGGSFFQLFDWRRPRKKLLAAGSSSPEQPKQVNEKDDCHLSETQVVKTEDEDDDFNGVSSVTAGSTEHGCDCASSVTNEDSIDTRAPSVIARLMGLDFLPTTTSEPYFNPADVMSFEDFQRRKDSELANPITLIQTSGVYSRKSGDLKCRRMLNNPLEKFQTDVLPTKSVKSVPISDRKLLSPIKSPLVIPQSNATHVLEASVRSLYPGHHERLTTEFCSLRSSSLTQNLRQLPECLATPVTASRLSKSSIKPNGPSDSQSVAGSHFSTKGNRLEYQRLPCRTEVNLVTAKGNGKSVPAANQARVNVHKIEGPNTRKGSIIKSEKPHITSNKQLKKASIVQKDELEKKRSAVSKPGALKQNKQKQIFLPDKNKLPLKSAVSKKSIAGNPAPVRNSISNRSLDSNLLRQNDCSRSKGPLNEKNEGIDNNIIVKRKRHIKPNVIIDEKHKQGSNSAKKAIDVVSFTFTSIVKSMPSAISEFSVKLAEEENTRDASSADDYCNQNVKDKYIKKLMPSSSVVLNEASSDALGILLEQKLRELTLEFGSSCSKETNATSDTCSSGDPLSPSPSDTFFEIEAESLEDASCRHGGLHFHSNFSPSADCAHTLTSHSISQKHEIAAKYSSEDACQIPSHQLPNLDCLPNEICSTYERYNHFNGNRKHACNHCGSPSSTKAEESEKQLPDSPALSFAETGAKKVERISGLDHTKRYKEQDRYLKKILLLAESNFKGSVTGYVSETLDPCLFELLETLISSHSASDYDKSYNRTERKMLFDCVCESFSLKAKQHFCLGYDAWVKGATKITQGQFPDEIYKEILGWRRKGDLMVDELVEHDMGRCIGKTVYFLNNAFEVGMIIEGDILTSLICEVVEELLL